MRQRAAVDTHSMDFIVDRSGMAPTDGKDWGFTCIPGGWPVPLDVDIVEVPSAQLYCAPSPWVQMRLPEPVPEDVQRIAADILANMEAKGESTSRVLCWTPGLWRSQPVAPEPGLLREFIRIGETEASEQAEAAIRRFARKWGPLHLCHAHARPMWHRRELPGPHNEAQHAPCLPQQLGDGRFIEPLWLWRSYATVARDIVHAAALDRAGRLAPGAPAETFFERWLQQRTSRTGIVADVLRLITDGAGYAVLPEWTDEGLPMWRAEVRALGAALGVALWNTLQGSTSVTVCAHCLKLFPIRQCNQRYCPDAACQTERKRVEKARLRATQQEPEYAI